MPLASPLEGQPHLKAVSEVLAERFAALELDKILLYVIDTVDSKALPFLAAQLNVTGLKGWNAAKTDQDRRNLLKGAIELHRHAGTPYAIKRALVSIGYFDAIISEGVGAFYDGEFFFDGFIDYGSADWATFSVLLDIGETKGINDSETIEARDLINEWKNQRSKLMSLRWKVTVSDEINPRESEFDYINVDITTNEDVDPISEEDNLEVTQDEIAENYPGLAEEIVLNILNSQGDVIETFTF
jgi:phage tail P2-like protein